MSASYEAIVLGLGGVGSSALYHLASRGIAVLGIEQFPLVHEHGSSHGETRVIRLAYFEHADYVPLLRRSWQLWQRLETAVGKKLLHRVGLLQIGPPDGDVISGVLSSAAEHELEVEELSATQCGTRFPGFVVPAGYAAVFEQAAGYLMVERCVEAHLTMARRQGAEIISQQTVRAWSVEGDEVVVQTAEQEYRAHRLVIAAGAWSGSMLQDLGIPLEVQRKHIHWFGNHSATYHTNAGCPTYLYELPTGIYYGFPQINGAPGSPGTLKMGRHDNGEVIRDPNHLSTRLDAQELADAAEFMRVHLPGVLRQTIRHGVCLYTMSPDYSFLVDHHHQHGNVVYAAGLSGHGFKFTTALGECLAQMVLGEETTCDVEFLRASRPSLQ